MTAEDRKGSATIALDRARLARILGMLGSAHEGEVVNAARQTERIWRDASLTWEEILTPTSVAGAFYTFRWRSENDDQMRRATAEAAEKCRQRKAEEREAAEAERARAEQRARQVEKEEAERVQRNWRRRKRLPPRPRTHEDAFAFCRENMLLLTKTERVFVGALGRDPARHSDEDQIRMSWIIRRLFGERAAA